MKIVTFILTSLLLLPLARAAGTCDKATAEEYSDLVFHQTLAKTCTMYLNPVDADFEPQPPFTKDQAKAELRRNQGGAIFEEIKKDAVPASPAAAELETWINQKIAEVRISHVTLPVRIFEIKQENICAKQIARQFAGMRENAKTPEIRKDIERDMEAATQTCLRHAYGYSNYVTREIVLGNATLQRLGESVSRFAVLHELCHIQNPAIQSQSFEETYCDAVALQWAAPLSDQASLVQLRAAFSIQIAPENENEDLLVLRSQLPVCCFDAQ